MKVTITYCTRWGYMPRAFRVKDEILIAYPNADVTFNPKAGGFFDVIVNDKLIFSKTEKIGTTTERFPESGEIVKLIQQTEFWFNSRALFMGS